MEGKRGTKKDVTQFHGLLKPEGLQKRNGSPQKGYSDRCRDCAEWINTETLKRFCGPAGYMMMVLVGLMMWI